jgi:ketosteroid isomerase-like protein
MNPKYTTLTEAEARQFAKHWIEAWNSHDLEQILSHYADAIILLSPIAAKLLGDPSGLVKGKAALRAYFAKGLEAYPDLKFELLEIMWGVNSLVLYYLNQKGIKCGEFMELGENGKVFKVIAHYNG